MTVDEFRAIALGLPDVVECSHMKHPDFRVNGKVFATLGYPDEKWGMVKLSPEEQAVFTRDKPKAFVTVKGAWGRQGCTSLLLHATGRATAERAIASAWNSVEAKRCTTSQPRRKTA